MNFFYNLQKLLSSFVIYSLTVCLGLSSVAAEEKMSPKSIMEDTIINTAAEQFQTDASQIEALIWDNRLKIPPCDAGFVVSFPFNDRVTTQTTCPGSDWKVYTRIKIHDSNLSFRYLRNMQPGETLTRADVDRQFVSQVDTDANIRNLSDVLGKTLAEPVNAFDVIQYNHFNTLNAIKIDKDVPEINYIFTANQVIPRGRRLSIDFFSRDEASNQTPRDAVSAETDIKFFEPTRTLMEGDVLRQSNIKATAAVRKDELLVLLIDSGAIQIRVQVKALKDATLGEIVELINVDSGKTIMGKVTDIGQVELIK